MPAGATPEEFCMANPDTLRGIHKAYLDAGVDLLTSCTFGGNIYKLPKSLDVFSFNRRMVEIAKEAAAQAGRPVFVAGNVGPTGHFAKPLGPVEPRDLIAAFANQIRGLVAGGADLIFIETQFDLAEARAAVAAARQECDLPVMVSMTFEQGVSLTGSTPRFLPKPCRTWAWMWSAPTVALARTRCCQWCRNCLAYANARSWPNPMPVCPNCAAMKPCSP